MIDELMEKYTEMFDDIFPLMCCMDMTDAEIEERIRECIKNKSPFQRIDGVDY